tara:strand:+ start:1371 stop:1667 length:297 start_codon:yes stop_codon:yes gene_type:complete
MIKIFKIFKVKNFYQLSKVFIVFGITGSLSVFASDYLLFFFNISENSLNEIIYWTIRILIVFPVYQVLLLIIGTIFGEYEYFMSFEKKFLKRIGFKIK